LDFFLDQLQPDPVSFLNHLPKKLPNEVSLFNPETVHESPFLHLVVNSHLVLFQFGDDLVNYRDFPVRLKSRKLDIIIHFLCHFFIKILGEVFAVVVVSHEVNEFLGW